MSDRHLPNYEDYDEIGSLAAGVYFDLAMIEACLDRRDYRQLRESIKDAKDACYKCMEITRQSIRDVKDEQT